MESKPNNHHPEFNGHSPNSGHVHHVSPYPLQMEEQPLLHGMYLNGRNPPMYPYMFHPNMHPMATSPSLDQYSNNSYLQAQQNESSEQEYKNTLRKNSKQETELKLKTIQTLGSLSENVKFGFDKLSVCLEQILLSTQNQEKKKETTKQKKKKNTKKTTVSILTTNLDEEDLDGKDTYACISKDRPGFFSLYVNNNTNDDGVYCVYPGKIFQLRVRGTITMSKNSYGIIKVHPNIKSDLKKNNIRILHSVIDPHTNGMIIVKIMNESDKEYLLYPGDVIASLVIVSVSDADLNVVSKKEFQNRVYKKTTNNTSGKLYNPNYTNTRNNSHHQEKGNSKKEEDQEFDSEEEEFQQEISEDESQVDEL